MDLAEILHRDGGLSQALRLCTLVGLASGAKNVVWLVVSSQQWFSLAAIILKTVHWRAFSR